MTYGLPDLCPDQPRTSDDPALSATALATNAYDHDTGPLRVPISHTPRPCRVWIEVDDGSPDHPVLTQG